MQICAAPRVVSQFQSFSLPFQPARSVVQGLRGGTGFGRCLTYFVLEKLCTAHPNMSERIWIDDLAQK
eukprot:512951-Pyramimonas_sp.AAC.1